MPPCDLVSPCRHQRRLDAVPSPGGGVLGGSRRPPTGLAVSQARGVPSSRHGPAAVAGGIILACPGWTQVEPTLTSGTRPRGPGLPAFVRCQPPPHPPHPSRTPPPSRSPHSRAQPWPLLVEPAPNTTGPSAERLPGPAAWLSPSHSLSFPICSMGVAAAAACCWRIEGDCVGRGGWGGGRHPP